MVQFYHQLLYIRGKSLSHKTKQPLFLLGILRNVNNFVKIVDIFQTFLILFSTKKWEIMLLNYFHEYAILLHSNFSAFSYQDVEARPQKKLDFNKSSITIKVQYIGRSLLLKEQKTVCPFCSKLIHFKSLCFALISHSFVIKVLY
jgi:hypothetical protein